MQTVLPELSVHEKLRAVAMAQRLYRKHFTTGLCLEVETAQVWHDELAGVVNPKEQSSRTWLRCR
jgi:hypothetical protein